MPENLPERSPYEVEKQRLLANSFDYKIKAGDTLSQVIKRFKIHPELIEESTEKVIHTSDHLALINEVDLTKLKIGQVIKIPRDFITQEGIELMTQYEEEELSGDVMETVLMKPKKVYKKETLKTSLKGDKVERLMKTGKLVQEGPAFFWNVSRGESIASIVNQLKGIPEFSYLQGALGRNRIRGFNINPKDLKIGMKLPLPMKEIERKINPKELEAAASLAFENLKGHTIYGPLLKAIGYNKNPQSFVEGLKVIAEQESKMGAVALHRYEPHHDKFSFSLYHVLMNKTGSTARKNLGLSEGDLMDPVNGSMLFIADLIEKAASRNTNLNYKDHPKKYTKLVVSQLKGKFPFNSLKEAEAFAYFYNGGGWRKHNPEYANNILKSLKGESQTATVSTESKSDFINYKIKSGDTFSSLSKRYNVSLNKLIQANQSLDPRKIKIGQIIKIPTSKNQLVSTEKQIPRKTINHKIKSGDTFSSLSKRYNVSLKSLLQANSSIDPKKIKIGQIIKIPSSNNKVVSVEAQSSPQTMRAYEARKLLSKANISLYSSGAAAARIKEDGTSRASNRTGLEGIRSLTVKGTIDLKNAIGIKENFVITGGNENGGGHQASRNPNSLSHGNGRKVDLRMNAAGRKLAQYIKQNSTRERRISFNKRGKRVTPMKYWFETENYEYQAILESDHIDLAVVRQKSRSNLMAQK